MVVGFVRVVLLAISTGIDIKSLAIPSRQPTFPFISASQYLTLRDSILAAAAFCRMLHAVANNEKCPEFSLLDEPKVCFGEGFAHLSKDFCTAEVMVASIGCALQCFSVFG